MTCGPRASPALCKERGTVHPYPEENGIPGQPSRTLRLVTGAWDTGRSLTCSRGNEDRPGVTRDDTPGRPQGDRPSRPWTSGGRAEEKASGKGSLLWCLLLLLQMASDLLDRLIPPPYPPPYLSSLPVPPRTTTGPSVLLCTAGVTSVSTGTGKGGPVEEYYPVPHPKARLTLPYVDSLESVLV